MDTWKKVNVDTSLLIAVMIMMAAITTGTITTLSWIDARVDKRIDEKTADIQYRMRAVEGRIIDLEKAGAQRHLEIVKMLDRHSNTQ